MDKKITIKYFLNETINPAVYYVEPNKRLLLYPVYVRVVYNRKSTRFKFLPSIHLEVGSDIEESFKKKNIYHLIERNNNLISRVIYYEIEEFEDDFSLKGFGSRYYAFSESLLNYFIRSDDDFMDLDEVVKKRRENTITFSRNLDNPLIQIGLDLKMLSNEDAFSNRFPYLLKKYVLLSFIFISSPKEIYNIHDWIFTEHKEQVESSLRTLNKYKSIKLFNMYKKSKIIDLLMPEQQHELKYNEEEIQQIENAANMFGKGFLSITDSDIDDFMDYMNNLLESRRKEIYNIPPTFTYGGAISSISLD